MVGRSPNRCDIGYHVSLEERNERYREQVEIQDDVEYRDQVEVRSFDVTDRSDW